MVIDSAIHTCIAAVAFALLVCGQAYALTVYDVIKLSSKDYSNKDIVTLIEVTDSAFALKAEDITRLKDLGVSETVIQAMLKAKPVEIQSDLPANPSKQKSNAMAASDYINAINNHSHTFNKSVKPVDAVLVSSVANKTISRKGFNAEPFEEVAANGHGHRIITLAGLRLFVLRDEGQYPSVAARGNAVVSRLEEAASFGSGTFQPIHISGKEVVMFSRHRSTSPVVIVSVSEDDAYTYQLRSGRRVTPELLAAYWSALLSDYWSIVIADEPPARLSGLHEGQALQVLYDRWAVSSASEDYSKLTITLLSLSNQQREHLLRLAKWVPRDFNTHRLPIAEHP